MTKLEDTLHDAERSFDTNGKDHENNTISRQNVSETEQKTYLRFASTVLPHLSDALALAQYLTGARATADDLLQEVFTRTFFEIDGATKVNARERVLTSVFSAWLARNETFPSLVTKLPNELEQAANKFTPEDDGTSSLDRESSSTPQEQLIAALPAIFRETLLLRKQGLSYRKISEIVGVPIGTVMSRLARSRQFCKEFTADMQA